jgi:membrane associated rhomboid family serine protease
MILIVLGLLIGFVTQFISIGGIPLVYFLVQTNYLVYQGWGIPSLATSMIVVLAPPISYLGIVDIFFNAISVLFVDGLLRNTYTSVQYYIVFFLTGLAGNLVSLLGYGQANIISFGASGGIFGLVAGAVTSDYALNGRINMGLVGWFIFIFVYSSLGGSVNVFAHLGGALVGLLAGYIIGKSRRRPARYF